MSVSTCSSAWSGNTTGASRAVAHFTGARPANSTWLDLSRWIVTGAAEGILFEILREVHFLNLQDLAKVTAVDAAALDKLWDYFHGHALINLENLEKSTVIYTDLDHLSEERCADIVDLRDQMQQFVRQKLSCAIEEGAACALLDVDLSPRAF